MGYTTDFTGGVSVEPPLTLAEYQFYRKLGSADQRVSGPWQVADPPSDHCQWVPTEDGTAFEWNGNEKFYESLEWMRLIVERLAASGHVCNGVIEAQGEDPSDRWRLKVENNKVIRQTAKIVYDN